MTNDKKDEIVPVVEAKLSHIEVESDASGHCHGITLKLDGRKLSMVKAFKIEADAGGESPFARVTIEMYARTSININAQVNNDNILPKKELTCFPNES